MTQKSKAHIRYRNSNGKVIKGVSTVIDSVLAKPALVKWANNLGLQGIDSTKFRDEMANIGTLAHHLVMSQLTGTGKESIDVFMSDYSPNMWESAGNALKSFNNWMAQHEVELILAETPLISERYQYGGTIDLYATVDGVSTLVDFKTGSGIYKEARYQVAAYKNLLEENGYEVRQTRILKIGRTADEDFQDIVPACNEKHWRVFEHCLEIYELEKELARK